ncbi:uncharacterized protein LOC108665323 [Hyalella azteca]|uniref:Uncharacterized protein LOC108665323 n=1 Tax=Hyalella azteca TaxID=294128 RepID=A0A8B7N145_HYAAZ|nr:uncharacterized protein LOC108665323 [Hyalella azteca]
MATALLACEICGEAFDTGIHKPLCLSCGHTFCFTCITNILTVSETKRCSKCRKQISQLIDQMPVNYSLIPLEAIARSNLVRSRSATPCHHKDKPQDFFCVDCLELMCFTCIRGTHATHKIEQLDDLLQKDECVMDSWSKIRSTMKSKLEGMNNFVSVSDGILSLADEILNLKSDFEGWKDALLAHRVSTEQDLEIWGNETSVTDENKRKKLKEMLSRLHYKPEDYSKRFDARVDAIKMRLDAASMECATLEAQTCPLMPPDEQWIVTSRAEGERAVASLTKNIKPSRLVVLSTHTCPIPGLGELMSRLASHNTGNISLLPLDFFWRPAGQADGGLEYFYNNFWRKVTAMYGSPIMVVDNSSPLHIFVLNYRYYNVRFDCEADLNRCRKLPGCIENVCCVRSVPKEIGVALKTYGCVVTRWHFPDLRDEDVEWLSFILAEYFNTSHQSCELVLPRDHLTNEGARELVMKMPNLGKLYHEANAAHLTSACHPSTECIELATTNILHWAIERTLKDHIHPSFTF